LTKRNASELEFRLVARSFRFLPLVAAIAVITWLLAPEVSSQSNPMPSTKNGEWPMYTANLRGSKYSPLDQNNILLMRCRGNRLLQNNEWFSGGG